VILSLPAREEGVSDSVAQLPDSPLVSAEPSTRINWDEELIMSLPAWEEGDYVAQLPAPPQVSMGSSTCTWEAEVILSLPAWEEGVILSLCSRLLRRFPRKPAHVHIGIRG
jgi:hypothetical protein